MGKKITLILVAVIAIAGLAGAAIFLKNNPEIGSKPEESDTESVTSSPETIYILGSVERIPATSVHIENQEDGFTVIAATETVPATIEGLEAFELQGVDSILTYSTALIAQSSIGKDGNPKDYGLDNPQATVTIEYDNQETSTLLLGNSIPGGSGRYAMVKGDEEIFVANNTSANLFLQNSLRFLSKNLIQGTPETAFFRKIVLGGSSRADEVVIEILPEDEMTQASGMMLNSHRIIKPLIVDLDSEKGNKPLNTLFGLVASDVVAKIDENTNLSDFGLETPYSTIAASATDMTQGEAIEFNVTLLVSAPDGEGMVYLIKDDIPLIYQVSEGLLPWLSLNEFDMMSKLIVLPFINKVSTVTIETPQKTTVFDLELEVTKKDDGTDYEDVIISTGGKPLVTKTFKAFYQTLISTKFDTDVEKEFVFDPASATKLLTVTYEYREGGSDVLTFYESAARRTLVSLNGKTPKYILSTQLERIISDTTAVAAGETVIVAK